MNVLNNVLEISLPHNYHNKYKQDTLKRSSTVGILPFASGLLASNHSRGVSEHLEVTKKRRKIDFC